MASTAVEAPPQPPADAVPLGHDELVAARKQPWKTQTVSDRDKERKGRRNSDGKKPAAQGSEAASRARSEGPPPLKEGSRRSRSRSRSPRGRAARSRSPEQSRRPQSRSRERSPRGRRSRSRERCSRSGERRGGGANNQQQHSRSRERRKERPVPLERRQSSGEGSRPGSNAGSKPPPHGTTHSVAPARGEESKAQLCREQREQTRQARRREEREEAERSKGGGSGQGGSTPKENSSRTSGGRLPVPPAVRPAATPTIALHYFDIQGPAEPARLALVVGGVPFEDVRYDRERMLKAKEAGELPYGQLPLLYVDGKCLAQSLAISEWCARQAGLVPADSFEQAKIFEVVQYISQDVRERVIAPTMREPDAVKKAAQRKTVNDETLPAKLAVLEGMVGPSGCLVGETPTMADLHFYVFANWVGMEVLDGLTKECILACPKLTTLVRTLNDLPAIKQWNAEKNPKLPWC